MSKSAPARVGDEDTIFRVETVPPPPGEDVHDCATKIGDWALALEEKRLATTAAQPTAKVNAFDLASALAKAAARRSAPPPPAPVLAASQEMGEASTSGAVLKAAPASRGSMPEENEDWPWLGEAGLPADGAVITIDVPDEAPAPAAVAATLERPAPPHVQPSALRVVAVAVIEVLLALVVLVVSALVLAR